MPADGAATGTDRRRYRVACCDDGPRLDGIDHPSVDIPEHMMLTLPPAGHDTGQERRRDVAERRDMVLARLGHQPVVASGQGGVESASMVRGHVERLAQHRVTTLGGSAMETR